MAKSKSKSFVVGEEAYIEGTPTFPDIPTTQVGSRWWHELLETHVKSFRFELEGESIRVNKESRRNSYYWIAYKRVDGILRRKHLGTSKDVTLVKLVEVAEELCKSNLDYHQDRQPSPQNNGGLLHAYTEQKAQIEQLELELKAVQSRYGSIVRILDTYKKRAKETRNWTEANRLLSEIEALIN